MGRVLIVCYLPKKQVKNNMLRTVLITDVIINWMQYWVMTIKEHISPSAHCDQLDCSEPFTVHWIFWTSCEAVIDSHCTSQTSRDVVSCSRYTGFKGLCWHLNGTGGTASRCTASLCLIPFKRKRACICTHICVPVWKDTPVSGQLLSAVLQTFYLLSLLYVFLGFLR